MRRARNDQLSFAFADSPEGGGGAGDSSVLEGKAFLLHIAESKEEADLAARSTDASRLLERVASASNLARALLGVTRNKGAAGVDGRSVEEVVGVAHRLLWQLQRALEEGRYQPGDIRRVWIPKHGGGQRGLGIPNVVDRWVQQAVLQVLERVFEPTFHRSSHGFRKGRGAKTAIAEATVHLEEGRRVAVDLDLSKFFDRVNHQRLLGRLSQRVTDGRVLHLIHQMLKARVVLPDGARAKTPEGTPQGGPLSPLLANIVLDELDWELERRGLRFVRYADDILIFVGSTRAARRVMASVGEFIVGRLRLVVNDEKSAIRRLGQIDFLGFRLGRNRDGQIAVRISPRSYQRLLERIRELTPRTFGQSLESLFERASRYLRGWMAHFQLCTVEGSRVFKRFDAHIRRRIRAVIIRQKKRGRHLLRALLARRVSRRYAAVTAFASRGIWFRSNTRGINCAYPNAWFAERLVSLHAEWERLNPPALASGQMLLFDLRDLDPRSRM